MKKFFSVVLILTINLCVFSGGISSVVYCSESRSVEPNVLYEKSVDGKSFYIECYDIECFPVIILALYNHGKLSEIKISDGKSFNVVFETECTYDSEKIMIWESIEKMTPVVKYENINFLSGTTQKIDISCVWEAYSESGYGIIEYYPSVNSTKLQKYKIDSTARYYHNNTTLGTDEEETPIDAFVSFVYDENGDIRYTSDMEITLVDNDGDGYFDIVKTKEYTYDVVRSVNLEDGIIEGMYETLSVKSEINDISVSVKNIDGEEMAISDIIRGDVIAYIRRDSIDNNYSRIEIVNLGRNITEGLIEEIDTPLNLICVDSVWYGFAGKEYPDLGVKGKFYLTMSGKVFHFSIIKEDMNYAYVIDSWFYSEHFDNGWKMNLLTKDNKVTTYNVRTSFEYNSEYVSAKSSNCPILESYSACVDENGNDLDKSGSRVILVKLNTKNNVSEIDTVASEEFFMSEYDAENKRIGDSYIEDRTVIFDVSAGMSDDYFATDISVLADGNKYTGYRILNTDDEYDCVIITAVNPPDGYTQNLGIVSSVSDVDIGETQQEAKRVEYYSASDKVCEYKLDTEFYTGFDDYDYSLSGPIPVIPEYEFVYITEGEVIPLETDDMDFSGVVKIIYMNHR